MTINKYWLEKILEMIQRFIQLKTKMLRNHVILQKKQIHFDSIHKSIVLAMFNKHRTYATEITAPFPITN